MILFLEIMSCQQHIPEPSLNSLKSPLKLGGESLGIIWQEDDRNPQLRGGSCFSWRCAGMGDPAIKRLPDGTLAVWFTTMGIRRDCYGKLVADGPWLGHAVGLNHTPNLTITPEHPVLPVGKIGDWDRYIETPYMYRDPKSQQWILWYLGYTERGGNTGFLHPAIGQTHALDSEGQHWQRSPAPIYRPTTGAWDGLLVSGPTVLQGHDGMWRLYYGGWGITGAIARQGIGLLTSIDGKHWQPYTHNPVLEGQPGAWDAEILEPAVIYFKGQYWMWYSGRPLPARNSIAIGLATSKNGLHWSRYPQNPVIAAGRAGTWNDRGVLAPDVIVESDGSLLMAAYGQSQAEKDQTAGAIGIWRSR